MHVSAPSPLISIDAAATRLQSVVRRSPLQYSHTLSKKYHANVYLKREDLQLVRSYKIRGAYNMMCQLSTAEMTNGVVCASAGNHAQGFAYSCGQLGIKGVVFMPITTPRQKVSQTKMFGGNNIEIILVGDNFDECAQAAKYYTTEHAMTFVPPFDDYRIIEGQGTVAKEILEDLAAVDLLFLPVGGGGLAAGCGYYFKSHSPKTTIVGLEPMGAPSMTEALKNNGPVSLPTIDRFVDGAAVKQVGELTFAICKEVIDVMHLVPEGKVCTTILSLYNEDAIVAEPAGALTIAALDDFKDAIKGKNVVCVVSGSNNDIDRLPEIKERSLQFEGLKHYFLIKFAQRPGALKEFVNNILGPTDDITRFEYIQKTNKEQGPALVGIELAQKKDYEALLQKMNQFGINFELINSNAHLFGHLI